MLGEGKEGKMLNVFEEEINVDSLQTKNSQFVAGFVQDLLKDTPDEGVGIRTDGGFKSSIVHRNALKNVDPLDIQSSFHLEMKSDTSQDALNVAKSRLIDLFQQSNKEESRKNDGISSEPVSPLAAEDVDGNRNIDLLIDYNKIRELIIFNLQKRRKGYETKYFQIADKLIEQHSIIERGTSLLAKLDNIFDEYKKQLLNVARDIYFLQKQSDVMDVRLRNRVEMHAMLCSCIVAITLDTEMTKTIMTNNQSGDINEKYIKAISRFVEFYSIYHDFQINILPNLLKSEDNDLSSNFLAFNQISKIVNLLKNRIISQCYPLLSRKLSQLRISLGLSIIDDFGNLIDKQQREVNEEYHHNNQNNIPINYAGLSSTNVSMQQQLLLRLSPLAKFLSIFAPDKAAEIRYFYIDTMSFYYRQAFNGYCSTCIIFVDQLCYQTTILGVEEDYDKVSIQQRRTQKLRSKFVLDSKRIDDILFSPETTFKDHLNPYIAYFDGSKYNLEIVITDIIRLVLDNSSSEYFFIKEFFGYNALNNNNNNYNRKENNNDESIVNTMFHATLDSTFAQIEDIIKGLITRCTDPITIMLCYYSNIQNFYVISNRNQELYLLCFKYLDNLSNIFINRLTKIFDSYSSNLHHCNPNKLLQSISRNPHYLTRQYADLAKSLLTVVAVAESPSGKQSNIGTPRTSVTEKHFDNNPYSLNEIIGRGLRKVLNELDLLLKIMAAEESSATLEKNNTTENNQTKLQPQFTRLAFIIENLQYIVDTLSITPIGSRVELESNDKNHLAKSIIFGSESSVVIEILQSYIDKFIHESLRKSFGNLIEFLQYSDDIIKENDKNISLWMTTEFAEKLEENTSKFNKTWKKDLGELNHLVMMSFPNYNISKLVLEKSLNDLIQLYQKYYEIFMQVFNWQRQQNKISSSNNIINDQSSTDKPTLIIRSQPIGVQTLIAEVRKYKPTFN